METLTLPLLRYAAVAVGGYFVAKGQLTADQVNTITGSAAVFGSTLWMLYTKRQQALSTGAK